MTLKTLLSETVTVIRYADATDAYGNTVPGAETRTDYAARLEQLSTEEIIRDRDTVIADWHMFLHPGTDITAYDRIEARGHLFEVVGLPNEQRRPAGTHHLEVLLRWVV